MASVRILLIRLSAIGDVINTLPAVSAIRRAHPDAYLAFAVEDKAKDVIVGHPDIDRVFVFPRKRWVKHPRLHEMLGYLRTIRTDRFDVSVDFQGNMKGSVHTMASGARRRVGFARGHCYEMNYLFTNIHVEPPGKRIHRVMKFASLLSALGIPPEPGPYKIPRTDEAVQRVDAFLRANNINGYVVAHPGTSDFGKEKRWPPERFAQLVARIRRELGLEVIATWGPGERALAQSIGGILSMKTTLMDLAELTRRARLFVSCDTGPMHLAAACGARCVALFGPKDPAIYGPWGDGHRVIHKSIQEITVDEVFAAVCQGIASR